MSTVNRKRTRTSSSTDYKRICKKQKKILGEGKDVFYDCELELENELKKIYCVTYSNDEESVLHASIFILTNTNIIYEYEWAQRNTMLNKKLTQSLSIQQLVYSHTELNKKDFSFCSIVKQKDVSDKKITLKKFIKVSNEWSTGTYYHNSNNKFQYPYNCRGYVDYVLKNLFNTDLIDWNVKFSTLRDKSEGRILRSDTQRKRKEFKSN